MKFNFGRITSALASAAMVSSTVALAAAASWPAPFVQNGSSDVAIVYGNSLDLGAVTDLSSALGSHITSSGGTTPTGDFVQLERPSNKFNLGNNAKDVFLTQVTKDHFSSLADGEYRDDDNDDFKYTQKIDLSEDLVLNHFKDTDYSNDPAIGINLESSKSVLNYTLDFNTRPTLTNAKMKNTDLPFFGKEYFVLSVDGGANVGLQLLDTASTTTINEGETTTVNIGGTTYTVTLSFVGSTTAVFNVNGQETNSLSEGQTYKLNDGSYIGLKRLDVQDYAGGVRRAEFSIGAGKLELIDGQEVELNDENVNGLTAYITNESNKLSKIVLEWKTDDREFITPDSELVMPGFGNIKLFMGEFITPEEEMIKFERDGSDSVRLTSFPFKDGTKDLNLLYKASGATDVSGLGRNSDNVLVTSAGNSITFNRTANHKWFVASYADSTFAESYLLSASVSLKDNDNRTTIKNEVTGQNICSDLASSGSATCSIGSIVLTVNNTVRNSGSDWWVQLLGSSSTNFSTLYSAEGMKLYLPVLSTSNTTTTKGHIYLDSDSADTEAGHNATEWDLYFEEEDKDNNLGSGGTFSLRVLSNSDNRLHISTVRQNRSTTLANERRIGDSDRYEYYVVSDLASRIVHDRSGNEYHADVTYHGSEAYGEIFLGEIAAATSSDGGTAGVPTLMDSELEGSSLASNNLIIVGGTCINTAARTFLGVDADTALCGAGWTAETGAGAGEWVIQTAQNPWASSKMATLVAGWEQGDTVAAATALRTQDDLDIASGNNYKGSQGTAATLVTT